MAFAAETGEIPGVAWWILGINVTWSVIYDTLYAMVDREDDLAVGIKSTAILFGEKDLLVLRALKVLMLALLVYVGWLLALLWPWYTAVILSGLLFAWQQYRVRSRDPAACFWAFLNNNWIGLLLFAGILGHYWVK